MRVLVVGRGWTGNKVYKELLKRDVDVSLASSRDAVAAIKFGRFDWVVNCAGVTGSPNVDACEIHPETTMQGNAVFPIMLQRQAHMHQARFMHWSSGCIYQGEIESVWARPNFFGSIYSISKGISDQYLIDKAVVVRIRMPFSSVVEDKNLITKIMKYAKHGKLYNAGQNSMTDHDEAVKISVDLIMQGAVDGPYNLVNSGSMDMYDIAKALNIEPKWFTKEEFLSNTKCLRSTCVIHPYEKMRPLSAAFDEAVRKCYW